MKPARSFQCLMAAALLGGFDPLVPYKFDIGEPAEMVRALRTLNRECGLRRFALVAPSSDRLFGRAGREDHVRIGESMAFVRKELADLGVEIGWWDDPTIRGGMDEPGQHVLDWEGHESPALCPLDDRASDPYLENLKVAARIGRPFVIVFEDDFTLCNHPGLNAHGGCFCPLHLAAFAARYGRALAAKEIAQCFTAPTDENLGVRQAFADVTRDSLVRLARRIRGAIDEVDPKIRALHCQCGAGDNDGYTAEALARALAGGTRPFVRVYGALYSHENTPCELPRGMLHALWSVQHLPKDFELIHESDPFPHTRFYNSARFFMAEIYAAYMAGMSDSYLYCTRYSDKPVADLAYATAYRDNASRFAAVRDFRRRSSVVGVRAVYDPRELGLARVENGTDLGSFATGGELGYFLGKFGFPATTLDEPVQVMFGSTPKHLPADEIRRILSRGVLLDADAALNLVARGFGDLLGCGVTDDPSLAFVRERVRPVDGKTVGGTAVYHVRAPKIAQVAPGGPRYVRLSPRAGAETWAHFERPDRTVVAPSFVVSSNALGGCVGILATSVKGNHAPYVYSPEKQEMLDLFVERASGGSLDVRATKTPCTWTYAAVSDDGRQLLVMVNNLAGDPRDDIELTLAARWRGAAVSRLDVAGAWQTLGAAGERQYRLPFSCACMVPEFLLLTRR